MARPVAARQLDRRSAVRTLQACSRKETTAALKTIEGLAKSQGVKLVAELPHCLRQRRPHTGLPQFTAEAHYPTNSDERRNTISELESSMNQVQVEQKSYQMPPQDGFTVAHFLTVADVERSLRFYETVFGGRILSRGDSSGAPGYIQIANTWLLVNPGGGPTPDKPSVTLSVPANPDLVSSFMNIRVADIQACYELWRSRGAEFITEPKPKYGETRCYIRDPDGYIIEVGQSNPGVAYG
jgi:catechol 2,3-dioxygenase-like lactoylglutathione lyase family enzyme